MSGRKDAQAAMRPAVLLPWPGALAMPAHFRSLFRKQTHRTKSFHEIGGPSTLAIGGRMYAVVFTHG